MSMINKEISEFSVQAYHEGAFKEVTKADVLGKWSVFFFYPADFTFVCPTELEDLANKYAEFQAVGCEIYSVSCDTHFVHKAWHDASERIQKIQYPMLADPTHALAKDFEVYIEADGLAERGVKATFFLIGGQLENNEDVVRRMDEEGHQVGIHTFDHVRLTGLSKVDFDAQVDRTRQLLKNILGHNDFLLRPPYGIMDDGIRRHAGCPIILWSIDPEDWRDQNTARVVEQVVSSARDGAIILMHDIFPESVDAAFQIVDRLHQQGYLFVTVEQLFAARCLPLEAGQTYSDAYP